jgi:hypothetical protein
MLFVDTQAPEGACRANTWRDMRILEQLLDDGDPDVMDRSGICPGGVGPRHRRMLPSAIGADRRGDLMMSRPVLEQGPPARNPPASCDAPGSSTLPIRTLFEYLIGRREAVLDLASTPSALGVAALLVLSAALARNYDQRPLLLEPWRLLGPFVASLATSGVLFSVIYWIAVLHHLARPGAVWAYRSFLTLYWATAPLAWLYGLPFERLLDPLSATAANLWVLGVVSAWRVALMVRVVSVLFSLRAIAAFPVVMVVADAIAWAALVFSPVTIIHVMGATDPRAQLVSDVSLIILTLSTITFPVWLILAAWAAVTWRPSWSVLELEPPRRAGRALRFAALIVAAWAMLTVGVQAVMPPEPRHAAPPPVEAVPVPLDEFGTPQASKG